MDSKSLVSTNSTTVTYASKLERSVKRNRLYWQSADKYASAAGAIIYEEDRNIGGMATDAGSLQGERERAAMKWAKKFK